MPDEYDFEDNTTAERLTDLGRKFKALCGARAKSPGKDAMVKLLKVRFLTRQSRMRVLLKLQSIYSPVPWLVPLLFIREPSRVSCCWSWLKPDGRHLLSLQT